jgi:GNAT superfamily N-acetyltransferase
MEPAVRIEPAEPEDIPEATACMAAAFANDPIVVTFFHDSPLGRSTAIAEFFSLLLEARISLGMPALVVREANRVSGLAMGYDRMRPAWPDGIKARWDRFEAQHPALERRFAAYDAVVDACAPSEPHFYLGALGVHPTRKGSGLGKALVRAFTDLAEADPDAQGTFLETGTEANLGFYQSLGFQLQGSGPLDAATLWCLYRPKDGLGR